MKFEVGKWMYMMWYYESKNKIVLYHNLRNVDKNTTWDRSMWQLLKKKVWRDIVEIWQLINIFKYILFITSIFNVFFYPKSKESILLSFFLFFFFHVLPSNTLETCMEKYSNMFKTYIWLDFYFYCYISFSFLKL